MINSKIKQVLPFIFLNLLFILMIDTLNAQLSLPDSGIFEPTFEVGVLNGKPAKPTEKLVKDEFSILSGDGITIQVKKIEDFPQKLLPGQRIAIFLENLNIENYYLRTLVGCKYDRGKPAAALAILFNGKPVWQHKVLAERLLVSAFIPSSYLKKDINILQIRNQSMVPICFDWLRVDNIAPKERVLLVISDLIKMPYPERKNFSMNGIRLNLRKTPEKMIVPEELKGKSVISRAKNSSITVRREKLEEYKEKCTLVIKANPEYKMILSQLWKQISLTLKCGKEPVLMIKGQLKQTEIENLALMTKGLVYYWVLENNMNGLEEKVHQINPKVKVCSPNESLNSSLLFNYSKSAYNVLSRIDIKNEFNTIPDIWAEWYYQDVNKLGGAFLKRKALKLPADFNEWLWSGGNGIILDKVIDGGMFFDEVTQEPIASYYTFKQASRLFQGNPEKIICNIVPVMKNDFLDYTYWSATKNADGIVTIQITSKYETNKEVKLTCPIPFSGKATFRIGKGFVKPDAKDIFLPELKTVKKQIDIKPISDKNKNGLFEFIFPLSKFTTIRWLYGVSSG